MKLQLTSKFLLLFFAAIISVSCKQSIELIGHPTNNKFKPLKLAAKDIRYGSLPRNNGTIYYDTTLSDPSPLIIFVPGGGWYQGSYDMWINKMLLEFVGSSGVQFAAINYSLSPFPLEINNPARIKHPAHIRDVASAIKWIYQNADKYHINRKQIFIMGHSAGAHLVSLLATNEKYIREVGLELSNIAGVISLDGGAYLTNDGSLMFPDDNDNTVESYYKDVKKAYYNAFTTDPKIYADACPYNHIEPKKNIPPFLLISQGADVIYRYKPNVDIANKLNLCNVNATLLHANGYEHSFIMSCIGTPSDRIGIRNAIKAFINVNAK